MNKKLIKTIASITCGLGVAISVPSMISSCGNNESSEIDPLADIKSVEYLSSNMRVHDETTAVWLQGPNKTFVDGKINEWKQQGINGFKVTISNERENTTYHFSPTECYDISYPDFIKSIELPSAIKNCGSYGSNDPQLPLSIEKITFDTDKLTFNISRGTYTVFSGSQNMNTIYFRNIETIDYETDSIDLFKNCGTGENVDNPKVVFNSKLSKSQKQKLFDDMVAHGLDKTKWSF